MLIFKGISVGRISVCYIDDVDMTLITFLPIKAVFNNYLRKKTCNITASLWPHRKTSSLPYPDAPELVILFSMKFLCKRPKYMLLHNSIVFYFICIIPLRDIKTPEEHVMSVQDISILLVLWGCKTAL